jgi:hypothetical protein
MGFIPHGHLDGGPSLRVARASASCAALSAVFSPQSSLLHSTMARGKGKTKQSSLQSAGMLPTLKKPAEAVGHFMTSCTCPASSGSAALPPTRRKSTSAWCAFEGLHKFAGGVPPSAAFEVQEMGETGDGSLELGVASGEIFWIKYPRRRHGGAPLACAAKGESWRLRGGVGVLGMVCQSAASGVLLRLEPRCAGC